MFDISGLVNNRGQGQLRSPGKKKSSKKFRDLEVRYMLLGQIFASNAKMTLKHFLKRENRSKNKISENLGKVPK